MIFCLLLFVFFFEDATTGFPQPKFTSLDQNEEPASELFPQYPGYKHVRYGETGAFRRKSHGKSADFSESMITEDEDRGSRVLDVHLLEDLISNNLQRTHSGSESMQKSTTSTTPPTVVDLGLQKHVHVKTEDEEMEQVSFKLGPVTKDVTTITGNGFTKNVVSHKFGDYAHTKSMSFDGNTSTENVSHMLGKKINRFTLTKDGEVTRAVNQFEFNQGGDYISLSVEEGERHSGGSSAISINENTLSLAGEAGRDESGAGYLEYKLGAVSEGTRATVNSTHTLTISATEGIDLDHDVTIVKNLTEIIGKLGKRHKINGIPGLVGKLSSNKKIEKLKHIVRSIAPGLVPPPHQEEEDPLIGVIQEAIPGTVVTRSLPDSVSGTLQLILSNICRQVVLVLTNVILEMKAVYHSYQTCTTIECVFDLYFEELKIKF